MHLPAHHHQVAHHHQGGGDVQENTKSLYVYYDIRALTKHVHYTYKVLVGLDKIEPSPSNREMGSILQCPLLPKWRKSRPTICALHTDCWYEYSNILAQQRKGIGPSVVPVLASIRNHESCIPSIIQRSAQVRNEGTSLVLQVSVTQAMCPCQEIVAFAFVCTNGCIRMRSQQTINRTKILT